MTILEIIWRIKKLEIKNNVKKFGKEVYNSFMDLIDWTFEQYSERPIPMLVIAVAVYTMAVIIVWEVSV